MPTLIPNWLTGAGVTAITITPATVASDGTVTPGSAQSLTGHLDEIVLEQENRTETIIALDGRQENETIVSSGTRVHLVEILTTANGCFLAGVGNTVDYALVGFARGGHSYAGTFVILGYKETLRLGKSVGVMTLAPCGVAATYT